MSVTNSILEHNIHAAITKWAEEIKEEVITDALKNFEKELRQLAGKAAIDLANYYSVERMGHDLVIRVKIEAGQRDTK